MTIEAFYTTEFAVSRSTWTTDGSGNDQSNLADAASFMGHVQQASAELAQNLGLAFTKTFTVWCPLETDVQEGDQMLAGGYVYHVKAKQTFENGDNKHVELHCERELNAD